VHSKKAKETAETLHERFGAHLSWRTKFLLAIAIDLMDILMAAFFFWAPGIHFVVNAIQFFIGLSLFGITGGLIQILELVVGLSPIIGTVIGAMPMLTIACAITYGMERAEAKTDKPAIMPAMGDDAMRTFLAGLSGIGVWFVCWKYGWVDIGSVGWFFISFLAGGFLLRFARNCSQYWGASVILGVIMLLCLVVNIWLSWSIPDAEKYRDEAWKQLHEAKDYRVTAAQNADSLQQSLDLKGLQEQAANIVHQAREKLADAMLQKKAPAQILTVDVDIKRLEKNRSGGRTLVQDAVQWTAENIVKPSEAPKQPEKKASDPQVEADAERLKVGPVQAKMYREEFVLDRAKELREKDKENLLAYRLWLLGLLVFTGVFGTMQYQAEMHPGQEDETNDDKDVSF